jgi:hypothetical protein
MTPNEISPADFKLLRDQIDQLQVASNEPKRPWYKDWAIISSVVALIFSIVSFYISHSSSQAQETRAKKEELRRLVGELLAIQEDFNTRIVKITAPDERVLASSLLNAKKNIHLESAELLANDLGDKVSPSELAILAREELNLSNFAKAETFFTRAPAIARNSTAKAVALRDLGLFYSQGTPLRSMDKARQHLGEAVSTTHSFTDDYSLYTTGFSYETWGDIERGNGFHIAAREKYELARECYGKITPHNFTGRWALEAMDRKLVAAGILSSVSPPAAGSVPPVNPTNSLGPLTGRAPQ